MGCQLICFQGLEKTTHHIIPHLHRHRRLVVRNDPEQRQIAPDRHLELEVRVGARTVLRRRHRGVLGRRQLRRARQVAELNVPPVLVKGELVGGPMGPNEDGLLTLLGRVGHLAGIVGRQGPGEGQGGDGADLADGRSRDLLVGAEVFVGIDVLPFHTAVHYTVNHTAGHAGKGERNEAFWIRGDLG